MRRIAAIICSRYTTDLDAVIQGLPREEAIQRIKEAMSVDEGDSVWFKFESIADLKTQGDYGGIGLVFRGGLGQPPPKIIKAQLFNIAYVYHFFPGLTGRMPANKKTFLFFAYLILALKFF